MRLEFIKNLSGKEVLARSIFSSDGSVLLKKGIRLTLNYIRQLEANGIYLVYIKDDRFPDIDTKENKEIDKLKSSSLNEMPLLFQNILSGSKTQIQESLRNIENIINYISEEKNVNTNLYEVKLYDDYTYIHSLNTGIMATYLGVKLGWNKEEVKKLGICGILHDIGKTKIPNSIINKKGVLTKNELNIIKKHPIFGGEILRSKGIFSEDIILGVLQHHEKVSGTGYPFGLKGDEICDYAKIISICDVFTAVSSNRSYRNRFSPNEAYELILSNSGIMFETKYVEKFRQCFAIYPLGCKLVLSNGLEGYVVGQNENFPDRPIIRVTCGESKKNNVYTYDMNLLDNPSITIVDVCHE
ncbi:HD-GYP domain-containing protein [Clostridium sp. KNHs214]|uniref:HD-GYP domain-containing protein n=1 Tax=Clostridium sp. KNHs214 TaxID=1540257 RepID=UPI00054EABCA|nr:HD-GYP domain-containing protein [Clostridium sp. KNHs214]